MGFDWSSFRGASGDSFTFDKHGDAAVGTITNIRVHTFTKSNGEPNPAPILTLRQDDGTERDLIASGVGLKNALASAGPDVGDKIAVVYTHDTPVQGRPQPMKEYDVQVKKASPLAQFAAPAPDGAAPAAAPSSGVSAADLL